MPVIIALRGGEDSTVDMHLKSVHIRNFRSVADQTLELVSGANLLVGPNAVGKTTILEAIRLSKAILVPRTQQESNQVLIGLSVTSPQLPRYLNYEAIAGNPNLPVEIKCTFKLLDAETANLPVLVNELARYYVAAQHGISMDQGPLALVQFLSSPMGSAALSEATQAVQNGIASTAASGLCNISLHIDKSSGIRGDDSFSQALFIVMESRLPPFKTLFSYFSADRALPTGDVPIQLGAVDAQQQLESHNSTPATKYQRLKSTIFSSMVESEASRQRQEETFKKIFTYLLRDRKIKSFSINQFGQAAIVIEDVTSGKTFDIDSMSSGEKGLILTFLLIARSIENGGLILFDEPELHLNSAVCKHLLGFLLDEHLVPDHIQAIICTHSPEIMTTALRRSECKVFHLRRNLPISAIRKHDLPEVMQALRLLGTSEIEELLYDAIVFVEGPDDVDLLETAFSETMSRIKFRELSGRSEIEKSIEQLMKAEAKGAKENISYFLFDHDNRPTNLVGTSKVVLSQWDRYCLENYLLETDIIYDVIGKEFSPKKWPNSIAEATQIFAEVAALQLKPMAIEEVFRGCGFQEVRLKKEDKKASFEEAATALSGKIEYSKLQLAAFDPAAWAPDFIQKCEAVVSMRKQEWANSWQSRCNGKIFIRDLYQWTGGMKADLLGLKRRLMLANMHANEGAGTESWKLLKQLVGNLLKATQNPTS